MSPLPDNQLLPHSSPGVIWWKYHRNRIKRVLTSLPDALRKYQQEALATAKYKVVSVSQTASQAPLSTGVPAENDFWASLENTAKSFDPERPVADAK